MKKIKLIGMMLFCFLLISCKNTSLEIQPKDHALYADIAIGVNFTDYMRLEYKDDETLYQTLYTHKVDYLVPQVFYYLPMSLNLNSKADWEAYFENWSLATKENNADYIKHYLVGTNIEHYVLDKLTEEPLLAILSLLIDNNRELFETSYEQYEKKIWPEIEQVLYTRANYLNEVIYSQRIAYRWQEQTQFRLPDYKVLLSYYDNEDLDIVSVTPDRMVLFYTPALDVTELGDRIQHFYGEALIDYAVAPLIQEMMMTYDYLEDNVYEHLVLLTKDITKSYEALLDGQVYESTILPPVVTNHQRINSGIDYFNKAFLWYLNDLKAQKAYIIDDELHYLGKVYLKQLVKDDVRVFYYPQYPIFVQTKENLTILTSDMDQVPEIAPDSEKMMFISPFGFEMRGNLWIYDFKANKLLKVLEAGENQSIKFATWYDENTILYIEGFAFGTVSQGGQLKSLNLKTLKSQLIAEGANDHEEITRVYKEQQTWFYELITFDEQYMNYTIKTKKIP